VTLPVRKFNLQPAHETIRVTAITRIQTIVSLLSHR
jgi:hypothetical protein